MSTQSWELVGGAGEDTLPLELIALGLLSFFAVAIQIADTFFSW